MTHRRWQYVPGWLEAPEVLVPPDLVSINPATGGESTAVTLTGTNFTADMTVQFGLDDDSYQAVGSPTYISSTSFTCEAPSPTDIDPLFGALGFVADIKVTNSVGTDTLLNCFTYEAL